MAKITAKPKKKTGAAARKAAKPNAKKTAKSSAAAKPAAKKTAKKTRAKKAGKTKIDGRLYNIGPIISAVEGYLNQFVASEDIDSTLTGKERQRLFGAGVRNYGFIEKSWDIVRDNENFAPQFFNVEDFGDAITEFDKYRQLYFLLEKFMGFVNEAMLVRSDVLFRDALRIYGNLREMSRARVPGAEPLFRALLQFFRRGRGAETVEGEPTIKQLERDFNSLIHGHADGEIVIKNEKPRIVAGSRKVVDKIRKGRKAIKEIDEAEIEG